MCSSVGFSFCSSIDDHRRSQRRFWNLNKLTGGLKTIMKWPGKQTDQAGAVNVDEIGQGHSTALSPSASNEKDGAKLSSNDVEDVQRLRKNHHFDPNLGDDEIEALQQAAKTGDAERVLEIEKQFEDNSPYDVVRAAVRNTDGEEIASTLRAWILGFIFVTVAAGINMFLSMRSPAITIPTVVILLLVYPVGCLWARIVPSRKFTTFGVTWSFNPGPFTIKEHTVIVLMANVTYGYAYSTDALLALQAKPLYNHNMGWGFALLFTLSSQLIGIGVAGLFRRFNVWPAAIIWPSNFSMTSVLYALHDKSKTDPAEANGWRISRYRFFLYVALGSFCWYWFPGVIFQGTYISNDRAREEHAEGANLRQA